MRSKYAELLNRLDAMQQAPYYATARETLADAERTIVALETALTELVHAYDAMPDGELGKGLTNGHFLRARPLVVPNAIALQQVAVSQPEGDRIMTVCIFHANCADGFGAAWVVRKALGDIEFHPGKYQEPPPDVTGKDVVMVDFSYKRQVLLEMAEKANSILILDHHKTAVDDLVDLPANVTTKFDMSHSGAMLTWEHFFPGEAPPPLLLHIEDRDLWRFALHNTRQIQANVFSFPYDFQVWDTLMAAAPAALAAEGEAIERKHFKDIRELLGVTTREMVIGGHRVPVANLPYTMSSDAGHEMAKGRPFAACYWDTPEGRVFSLRSNDEGVDVSEVAKQYGGGGHRNASGFKVSFAAAAAFESCRNREPEARRGFPDRRDPCGITQN